MITAISVKNKFYIFSVSIAVLSLFLARCPSEKFSIISCETGSDLNSEGYISDKDLTYKFKEPKKKRYVRDLFNYIYFEGDTLCFSIAANEKLAERKIKIEFMNPATGKSRPAERIEIKQNMVYGFSLIGSILEEFFKDQLNDPIPERGFCCRDIPFIIKVTIENKGNILIYKFNGSFKIEYI